MPQDTSHLRNACYIIFVNESLYKAELCMKKEMEKKIEEWMD
jgi:hypothetical protein